jgi:hypothetical protein
MVQINPLLNDFKRAASMPRLLQSSNLKITNPFILKYRNVLNWSQLLFLSRVASVNKKYGVISLTGTGSGKFLQSVCIGPVLGKRNCLLIVPVKSVADTEKELIKFSSSMPELLDQNIKIISSNDLSLNKSRDVLYQLSPEIIIIDEAQDFKDLKSARTKALIDYINKHPDVRVFILSATLITLNVCDYLHLFAIVCKENSPLSVDTDAIPVYQALIDIGMEQGNQLHTALHNSLSRFPGKNFRERLSARIHSSEYVVFNPEVSTSAPIRFYGYSLNNPTIDAHLERLENEWVTPSGEALTEAVEKHLLEDLISLGVYPRYTYHASDDLIEKWYEARREWQKVIRSHLVYENKHSVRSAAELVSLVDQGFLDRRDTKIYKTWIEIKDKVSYTVNYEYIDPEYAGSLVRELIKKYSLDNLIIWVKHVEIGKMLSAALNIPFYNGSGKDPKKEERFIILSVMAYYAGKNFQKWNNNLLLESAPNAMMFEQLISRTHRYGQNNEVRVFLNVSTVPLKKGAARLKLRSKHLSEIYAHPVKLEKEKGGRNGQSPR